MLFILKGLSRRYTEHWKQFFRKVSVYVCLDYEIIYCINSYFWCNNKGFSKLELPLPFLNKGSEIKFALNFSA